MVVAARAAASSSTWWSAAEILILQLEEAPHARRSPGMVERSSQPPLAYRKKSLQGAQVVSRLAGSSGLLWIWAATSGGTKQEREDRLEKPGDCRANHRDSGKTCGILRLTGAVGFGGRSRAPIP